METHDFAGTVTFVRPRQFIIVSSDIFVPAGLLNATIAVGDRVVGTMVPGRPGARNPWTAIPLSGRLSHQPSAVVAAAVAEAVVSAGLQRRRRCSLVLLLCCCSATSCGSRDRRAARLDRHVLSRASGRSAETQ